MYDLSVDATRGHIIPLFNNINLLKTTTFLSNIKTFHFKTIYLVVLQCKPTISWNSWVVLSSQNSGCKRTPCGQPNPIVIIQRKIFILNLHNTKHQQFNINNTNPNISTNHKIMPNISTNHKIMGCLVLFILKRLSA